jgi:hypothetical protein
MSKSKTTTKPEGIVSHTDKARELIFNGQAIVALAASASTSSDEPGEEVMERALGLAYKLLDDAAAMLDPMSVERVVAGEVAHA